MKMGELPKDFEICLWCGEPMEEGIVHLPTEQKGWGAMYMQKA